MLAAMTSTPWRAWLFLVTGFGAFAGIRGGLETGSLLFGLISGVVSGVLFASLMVFAVARRPLAALRDLPGQDRAAVIRAVRRGEPVRDRRSAQALLAYAEELRRQDEGFWGRSGRLIFTAFAVLSVPVVIGAVAEGDEATAVRSGLLGLGWAVAAAVWPRWQERTRSRIDASVRAAELVLGNQRRLRGPSD